MLLLVCTLSPPTLRQIDERCTEHKASGTIPPGFGPVRVKAQRVDCCTPFLHLERFSEDVRCLFVSGNVSQSDTLFCDLCFNRRKVDLMRSGDMSKLR